MADILHSHGSVNNYLLWGLIFAPFALTLIMGAIHCLFRNAYSLKGERVPYILFWYSFRRNFDTDCCVAMFFLFILFVLDLDSKFTSYGLAYIMACFFVTFADSGDHESDTPDAIESERISTVKVFLLSLAFTPIAGYIAVRMYKAEQNKKTETMKLHLARAEAYLEAKDYTNAILDCKEVVDVTDKDEDSYDQREVRYDILNILAKVYCEQEKYSEAIGAYSKAMVIFPYNQNKARTCVNAVLHNEWAYDNQGSAYIALLMLKVYEELYPYEESFSKERIRLMQITKEEAIEGNNEAGEDDGISEELKKMREHVDRGTEYYRQEDYEKAVIEFTQAIRILEQMPEGGPSSLKANIYLVRARAYLEQKDYVNAIADDTKVIEFAPNAHAYGDRAKAYEAQKDCEKAIIDYTNAIELDPDDKGAATYYGGRAGLYHEQKAYDNALADYTKAIELSFEDISELKQATYYHGRAEIYLAQKDYTEAIADYTKAIELAPEDTPLLNKSFYYSERADVYYKQNDYEHALADYTRAIECAPEDNAPFPNKSFYYANRAKVYTAQKNYARAMADYTKAIELDPGKISFFKSDYYSKRASLYLEQKDYTNAIADATEAIELFPDYSDPYLTRAKVYLAQKEYEKAIADCKRAIDASPQYSGAHELLADVYTAQEQFADAIKSYTNAIETFSSEDMEKKADIYQKRGEAHQKLGDTEQAEADFAMAKGLFDEDATKEEKTATEKETVLSEEEDEEKRRFCSQCGTPLEVGQNFCKKCGTSIPGRETERRQ